MVWGVVGCAIRHAVVLLENAVSTYAMGNLHAPRRVSCTESMRKMGICIFHECPMGCACEESAPEMAKAYGVMQIMIRGR